MHPERTINKRTGLPIRFMPGISCIAAYTSAQESFHVRPSKFLVSAKVKNARWTDGMNDFNRNQLQSNPQPTLIGVAIH
jgi:hypothetical protein